MQPKRPLSYTAVDARVTQLASLLEKAYSIHGHFETPRVQAHVACKVDKTLEVVAVYACKRVEVDTSAAREASSQASKKAIFAG